MKYFIFFIIYALWSQANPMPTPADQLTFNVNINDNGNHKGNPADYKDKNGDEHKEKDNDEGSDMILKDKTALDDDEQDYDQNDSTRKFLMQHLATIYSEIGREQPTNLNGLSVYSLAMKVKEALQILGRGGHHWQAGKYGKYGPGPAPPTPTNIQSLPASPSFNIYGAAGHPGNRVYHRKNTRSDVYGIAGPGPAPPTPTNIQSLPPSPSMNIYGVPGHPAQLGQQTPTKLHFRPHSSMSREEKRACSMCPCNRMAAPICASNGETYSNECIFNCIKRTCPEKMQNVKATKRGKC